MKQSLKTYFGRMRGSGKCAPRHSLSWIFWSWVGAFLGILLVAMFSKIFPISATDSIFLIGSFGASAVLIYGTPHVPYAQPRNLIGGHFISALIGVAIVQYLPLPIEFQAAFAVSLAIVFMHVTRTIHPPGGASALIAVIGSPQVHSLGFMYAFAPVLSGAAIMLIVALLVNNLRHDEERHYPRCWW
jgi:CBS domain-containing membrane protein